MLFFTIFSNFNFISVDRMSIPPIKVTLNEKDVMNLEMQMYVITHSLLSLYILDTCKC